jgi:hypothetical protein
VIAGLDPKTFEPFICSLDLIGCPMVTEDFVVSGTCSEQMYGMCESLWEPDMVSVLWRRGLELNTNVQIKALSGPAGNEKGRDYKTCFAFSNKSRATLHSCPFVFQLCVIATTPSRHPIEFVMQSSPF